MRFATESAGRPTRKTTAARFSNSQNIFLPRPHRYTTIGAERIALARLRFDLVPVQVAEGVEV
jgi:hypothetical protein